MAQRNAALTAQTMEFAGSPKKNTRLGLQTSDCWKGQVVRGIAVLKRFSLEPQFFAASTAYRLDSAGNSGLRQVGTTIFGWGGAFTGGNSVSARRAKGRCRQEQGSSEHPPEIGRSGLMVGPCFVVFPRCSRRGLFQGSRSDPAELGLVGSGPRDQTQRRHRSQRHRPPAVTLRALSVSVRADAPASLAFQPALPAPLLERRRKSNKPFHRVRPADTSGLVLHCGALLTMFLLRGIRAARRKALPQQLRETWSECAWLRRNTRRTWG